MSDGPWYDNHNVQYYLCENSHFCSVDDCKSMAPHEKLDCCTGKGQCMNRKGPSCLPTDQYIAIQNNRLLGRA